MTRSEAISTIEANLARLREDELEALAEMTSAWANTPSELRLTDAERAAVARSIDDFAAGRTLSLEEAEARTSEFLAARRAGRMPR